MITASIVTYNTPATELARLLAGVGESSIDTTFIVDNSPNDELRHACLLTKTKSEYLYGQGNIGYGAGHNLAIRKAMESGAAYHVVLNPDIWFGPGTIESLAAYMDEHPDTGQMMPRIVYPDGRLQYLCKLLPTPFDLIVKRFLPESWTRRRMDRFQLKFTGYDKPMNVPFLSGCFMFFRVPALKETGLFDERFFMYGEDIDLSRRMHEKYRTLFYPAATAVHAHAAASKSSLRMLKVHIVNVSRYFNKWGWIFDRNRRRINDAALREIEQMNR